MKTMIPSQIELRKFASEKTKKSNEWFFKTAPGEYGFGDQFIGVRIPDIRKVVRNHRNLQFLDIKTLLDSTIHEERMLGLLILRFQYEKSMKEKDEKKQQQIFKFFLQIKNRINNWDLVDNFVPQTIGHFIFTHPSHRSKVFKWVTSKNLWYRRMAIMSTFYFLRQNQFQETISLSKFLLHDSEDLLHKASGWMLREMGKRSLPHLIQFLDQYSKKMPRTMLRYSIEKLPERQRKFYLKK